MRVAFVGCGYVADLYAATLPNHPELELTGVHDRDPARQGAFTQHHGASGYPSLDALLADRSVELVVNLTNPRSHAHVTQAALLAGKHVYVEKPLALEVAEASGLVELAADRGLRFASAPCNLLGEAAQTAWRAIREGVIGTPRLAYAELDAGPILRAPYREWVSASGAPWPYEDEFRTGCAIEHAGYLLTWLTAFFGPVALVNAYAAVAAPNFVVADPAPNFFAGCLEFANGMMARVTGGAVAPADRSLRVIGDAGVLTVADAGRYESPVTVDGEPYPLVRERGPLIGYDEVHQMDFARGVADLAAGGDHLPADHALHVLELTLTMARASGGVTVRPETTFAPVPPMPWAI